MLPNHSPLVVAEQFAPGVALPGPTSIWDSDARRRTDPVHGTALRRGVAEVEDSFSTRRDRTSGLIRDAGTAGRAAGAYEQVPGAG